MNDLIESNDKTGIKQYLINTYSKKSIKHPKKSFSFYLAVVKLYPCYLETFNSILNNITNWGYYKDLILLIVAARKENICEVEKMIYSFILNHIKKDIERRNKNESITQMAKWLPREGSSFDKKIGFVDRISVLLFPKIKNKFSRREKYRKVVAGLNKYIGTLEIYICSKEYDKIDLEKIPKRKLNKYIDKLIMNNTTKEKIINYFKKEYSQYDLINLVKKCLNNKIKNYEKIIINNLWEKDYLDLINNFLNDNILIKNILENHQLVLDLSKDMFDKGLMSSIILIILSSSYFGNKLIINAYTPQILEIDLNNKLTDIIDKIKESSYSYKEIKFDKIREIESGKIVILTSKNLEEFDNNTRICTLVQGIVNEKKINNNIYKIGIIEKPRNIKREIFVVKRENLIKILENSKELEVNNTPFYIFIGLIVGIYITLYSYYYFV